MNEKVTIRLYKTFEADPSKGLVPSSIYDIVVDDKTVGKISLRLGDNEYIYYGGHIGYTVDEAYRGHNYAYEACLLIKDIAIEEGLTHLVITCNPDNLASNRICEKLGAVLDGHVDLPEDNDMYIRGERQKVRYKWTL